MTLEYILRAAVSSMIKGHHAPRCFSAHVPGKGYISQGLGPMEDRADYLQQLEREYDYQNADEQIDESIRCNEYEFTEDGRRA